MSFDPSSFHSLLSVLGRDSDVAIRIGWATNEVDFRQKLVAREALPEFIQGLIANHTNAYFEINPSTHEGKGRSSANEISRLVALWADVDFKGGGMHNEDGARQLIEELSRALGAPPAAVVFSGGGCQPYWVLEDGDATTHGIETISALSKRWGQLVKRFAADLGGAADGVFDLARVFRIPGTVNVKYGAARPVSVEFADHVVSFTVQEITDLLDEYGVVEPNTGLTGEVLSPESEWQWADEDCQMVGIAHEEISTSVPNSRHQWSLKWSAILYGMIRHQCITEASFYKLRDLLVERFRWICSNTQNPRDVGDRELNDIFLYGQRRAEQWDDRKLQEELRFHLHASFDEAWEALTGSSQPVATPALPPIPSLPQVVSPRESNVTSIASGLPIVMVTPEGAPAVTTIGNLAAVLKPRPLVDRMAIGSRTDTGNAERLAKKFAGEFIYVPSMGWMRFDGGRYVRDDEQRHVERAKDVFTLLAATGTAADQKWALKSLSAGGLGAAVKLAQSTEQMAVAPPRLDADEYGLCTPGGMVDLRTGVLRAADPLLDLHTRQTSVTPSWTVKPLKFLELLEWMQPDPEIRSYLQRLAGIALIGNVDFQIFPIFVGPGANGKTTLLELWGGVLGEYSSIMPKKFLVEKMHTDHPTEIMNLRGVRLAINSEVPPKAKFDEDFVKTLTGERRLTGRYMGKDFAQFLNTALQVMAANHLPSVPAGGRSYWRRIRKLDFKAQISGDENKRLVPDLLANEGEAILAWMIDGARDVIANGEQVPDSVLVSTNQYRYEEDSLARFADQRLLHMPGMSASRDAVYMVYRQWAIAEGLAALPQQQFAREMLTQRPDAAHDNDSVYANYVLVNSVEAFADVD